MNQIARVSHENLPDLVQRAADALLSAKSSAEVLEARDMASVAYTAAKTAGRMARAKEAHDTLLADVYRAQADALLIEARAKMRLADEYDQAQARGEVASGSVRTDIVDVSNDVRPATAADLGLRRDEIHEARQIRDAEKEEPGLAERALSAMVERGEEPTKARLRREVLDAARSAGRAPSNKNPLHRADASRDAVIRFTGDCRRVAEADGLDRLATFTGNDAFRAQMIEQAAAALETLARFLEVAGEKDA